VQGLPAGIKSRIGERGATLSGGQVQRLALARAVYRQPALLVLDEPTNSLDGRTERAVLEALDRLKHRCAILLIAHHPQALSICDRVEELADGVLRPAARPAGAAEDPADAEAIA
jgi:ABC-type bacteriocin/lantibiotic exporter with double-glycine peptidase domain